ncbi:hypothetical protein ACFO1S_07425 [Cohnella boryungensis]|uniref:Uncharacterized protein n=1 Tax=Cohnella boryungensis TaxID=768479 RepID=A0ABV8S6V2_9BACL
MPDVQTLSGICKQERQGCGAQASAGNLPDMPPPGAEAGACTAAGEGWGGAGRTYGASVQAQAPQKKTKQGEEACGPADRRAGSREDREEACREFAGRLGPEADAPRLYSDARQNR